MKSFVYFLVVVFLAFCATTGLAATNRTINVKATIASVSGGLNVAISKVVGDVFTPDSAINFGTLTFDSTYRIFRPSDGRYYAVDIGVMDNTGTAWTLTHTRTSFKKDDTNNLDNNVNVTFMKQTSDTTGTQLRRVSFANSNNVSYTKSQLAGGWLRIYYGIASGKGDASGVTPIGLDKPAGTYAGTVTITLTP